MEMSSNVNQQFRSHPISIYTSPLLKNLYFFIKRIIDITISILLLIILLPLFLIICCKLYIKGGGAIFHKEMKMGKNSRPFIMYTFRTKSPQSEVIRALPPHPFPLNWKHGVPNNFTYREPITTILTQTGQVLMKYKLHRLPQLFNVIKGDVSIIGPEPEKEAIANYYNSLQKRRLKIRPGLTGYTQLNNSKHIGYDQKIKDDMYYLEHCSYYLDVKILGKWIKQKF